MQHAHKFADITMPTYLRGAEFWYTAQRHSLMNSIHLREHHITHFGFPIVTREVLHTLVQGLLGKRVIDVGAGTGFISHLLQTHGVNVTAIDDFSQAYVHGNFANRMHCNVLRKNALDIDLSQFDVVIMSWPDYNEPTAFNVATKMHSGQYLLYQGESEYGCTGDAQFFELLNTHFKKYINVSWYINNHHVQFDGIHDYWGLYRKL